MDNITIKLDETKVTIKNVRVVCVCIFCKHEWGFYLRPSGQIPSGADVCSCQQGRIRLEGVG